MKRITPPALDRAVELLREAAPDATIVLFGSHARGDARSESDVDLLVVSRRLFREWADVPGTVIYEAAKEGRVLHAAA